MDRSHPREGPPYSRDRLDLGWEGVFRRGLRFAGAFRLSGLVLLSLGFRVSQVSDLRGTFVNSSVSGILPEPLRMLWAMTARTKKPNAQNAGHLQEAAEEVIMYGGFLKEAINTGIFHWKNGNPWLGPRKPPE